MKSVYASQLNVANASLFVKTIKIKVPHLKDSIRSKLRNFGVSIDGRGLNTDDSL